VAEESIAITGGWRQTNLLAKATNSSPSVIIVTIFFFILFIAKQMLIEVF
jgi:hypothetical protein